MGCFTSLLKYILFFLNFIFFLAGGALLGVGIWFQVDDNVDDIVTVANVDIYVGSIAFITLGSIMFFIAFCGCCGAIKENKCLLGTYFTFVLLVFLVQVGIAIWGFVEHSTIEASIKKGLNDSVPIDLNNTDEYNAVIAIQKSFKCCGLVNGCGDWPNGEAQGCTCTSTPSNNETCKIQSKCTNHDNPGQPLYTKDCYDSIYDFVEDNIIVFGGVALGIALAEILVMIFAMIVCNSAGKDNYTTV